MEPSQIGLLIGLVFFVAVAYVGFKYTETKGGKGNDSKKPESSSSSEKKE